MIAVIGDIHAKMDRLDEVLVHLASLAHLQGVLLVGDVSWNPPWHRRADALEAQRISFGEVLDHIRARVPAPLAYVPGNHDPRVVEFAGNADRRLMEIGGQRIFGIGGAGPTLFGLPYEWGEAEIRGLTVPPCDIILSHCPPLGTPLDALHRGRGHVGSAAIAEIAAEHPGVLVCGHIHESAGFATVGRSLCVNVGALGEPFGRACLGLIVRGPARWRVTLLDLDSGERRTAEHPALP